MEKGRGGCGAGSSLDSTTASTRHAAGFSVLLPVLSFSLSLSLPRVHLQALVSLTPSKGENFELSFAPFFRSIHSTCTESTNAVLSRSRLVGKLQRVAKYTPPCRVQTCSAVQYIVDRRVPELATLKIERNKERSKRKKGHAQASKQTERERVQSRGYQSISILLIPDIPILFIRRTRQSIYIIFSRLFIYLLGEKVICIWNAVVSFGMPRWIAEEAQSLEVVLQHKRVFLVRIGRLKAACGRNRESGGIIGLRRRRRQSAYSVRRRDSVAFFGHFLASELRKA